MLNKSGIIPTEYKVLIDPQAIEAKIGSIFIPETTQDAEKFSQTKGRIVATSPLAFSYASNEEWAAAKAEKPKAGDVVLYAKYAGLWVKGKDGKEYIVSNDKDIVAIVDA